LADIFEEVDEEVRRDRAVEFLRRYGSWLLAGAVGIVAIVGGYNGWQQYQRSQREKASVRFEAAANEARTDKPKALATYESLSSEAPRPYADLARMRIGQLKAEMGDGNAAVAMYGNAAGALGEPELRDLAQYLAVLQKFDTAPPDELKPTLQALAAPDRALRAPAQELLATLALRSGDIPAAREAWKELMSDIATPPAMRQRAADMLTFLPGDKK